MAIIFREFSKDYKIWNEAVKYLAQIDVLISFTRFSRGKFFKLPCLATRFSLMSDSF